MAPVARLKGNDLARTHSNGPARMGTLLALLGILGFPVLTPAASPVPETSATLSLADIPTAWVVPDSELGTLELVREAIMPSERGTIRPHENPVPSPEEAQLMAIDAFQHAEIVRHAIWMAQLQTARARCDVDGMKAICDRIMSQDGKAARGSARNLEVLALRFAYLNLDSYPYWKPGASPMEELVVSSADGLSSLTVSFPSVDDLETSAGLLANRFDEWNRAKAEYELREGDPPAYRERIYRYILARLDPHFNVSAVAALYYARFLRDNGRPLEAVQVALRVKQLAAEGFYPLPQIDIYRGVPPEEMASHEEDALDAWLPHIPFIVGQSMKAMDPAQARAELAAIRAAHPNDPDYESLCKTAESYIQAEELKRKLPISQP